MQFKLRMICSILLIAALSPIAISQQKQEAKKQDKPAGFYLKPDAVQKEVTIKAEDGWVVYGTYSVPETYKAGEKLPAILMLHATMHSQTAWMNYAGWANTQNFVPTLRIDWRGRGKSDKPKAFLDFTQAERDKVVLDVRAALDFLAAQKEVDATRIGVAAEEFSATPAILGAMEDARVRVFVLLSGLLNDKAMDLIANDLSKPLLYVVSKEDKESFDDLTKAYNSGKVAENEIWVQDGLGVGATMGSVWRNRNLERPVEESPDYMTGNWMLKKLKSLGQFSEITIKTADGWTLYGNLRLPDGIGTGKPVPGVVLLPTALADRSSFIGLERDMVREGVAVLDLEWRGVGKSIAKGNYIEMTLTELMQAPKDVSEGVKFLASQKGVDPARIGVLGAAFSAKLAFYGTAEDQQVKALAMLTPVVWPWEKDRDYQTIANLGRPVLLVTGDGMGAMTKQFSTLTASNKRNRVITYPGAIFGYLLLRNYRDLGPNIATWFKDELSK